MLGITFIFCCFHLSGYYNVILAYSYRFIFTAFTNPLPFADETTTDNHYFKQEVLGASASISEFGQIQPSLFLLYTLSLFICYMIVKNGVKTSGKVAIFTAISPYFFFIVLAIRALFLDGAIDGLRYLFIPDFSKLLAVEIWIDAIVQVFYQITVGISGIINLSSMKPKK
jgi:SNF family Na+-dependent transporter